MAGDSPDPTLTGPGAARLCSALLNAADRHDIEELWYALRMGADVNQLHPELGLAALHVAIGNNDIVLCRLLIEECGAGFFPDAFGRWPTVIAAECQVDAALCDYIVEQEARALGQDILAELRE